MAEWKRIHLPMQEPQETRVQSLGWENPLEEEMATHSSILAWEIPLTEEPGVVPKEQHSLETKQQQQWFSG